MATEPLYYAVEPDPNGRTGTVWKRPVETFKPDGTSSVQMGFNVCDCNEDVDGAATTIADALNRLPELEAVASRLANHYEQHFNHLVRTANPVLFAPWTAEGDSALAGLRKVLAND